MDSINKKVLTNFQNNDNIEVVFTPNQNESDFTKSVEAIKNYASKHSIEVK